MALEALTLTAEPGAGLAEDERSLVAAARHDPEAAGFAFEKSAYQLADGTAVTYAVGKPKGEKVDLEAEDWAELNKLRQAGAGEALAEYTDEINGPAFDFKPKRYVLSDGTEVVQAPAEPVTGK